MTPTPEQRAALAELAAVGKKTLDGPIGRQLRREGWAIYHDQVDGVAELLWSITEAGRRALEQSP